MRVFVTFGKTYRWAVDVPPEATVQTVKDIISKKTFFDTHDNKREEKFLNLVYGGASLHGEWILQDISINSGATLACEIKVIKKPSLKVFLGYSGDILEIMEEIHPSTFPNCSSQIKIFDLMLTFPPSSSGSELDYNIAYPQAFIGQIRSLVSTKTGLPVSVFRLCQISPPLQKLPKIYNEITVDKFKELYDCKTMGDYGLELGSLVKLEIWDGWKEFINASLKGHEKIVGSYLSRDREERKYQRRVALHIAAHFDYPELAQNMLRYGARPDQPVGAHPTREWCSGSDHVESKKCPVHEACEKGNVTALRIMMKSNILSFGVKDGKGRLPWNIVVEHFHKDCFEYLLARQWARRSGKDPDISFPILIYCRIIQWYNRARGRVLILHGCTKSTLRSRLIREGGLVGTTVAVDGLSNKRMSSVSLAEMPRPTLHPSRMLPALAKARRRFKREHSATYNSNRRRSVTSRRSSRVSFQRAGSIAESDRSSIFDSPELAKYAVRSQLFDTSPNQDDCGSVTGSCWGDKREEFPIISRTNIDSVTIPTKTDRKLKSRLVPLQQTSESVMINGEKVKGIPLSIDSVREYPKPYCYWGDSDNHVENTLSRFESYRGTSSRDNAIKCLTLTGTFVKTPWLKRATMAARLAKRGVIKNTAMVI